MATFDIASAYTLPEVLRTKAPDGSHMSAIDVLSGRFPIVEEAPWFQANDDTSHEFLRFTSEPTGSLVRLNEGAAFEAVSTVPVREQMARMESNLKIDIRILERAPDPVAYRREREAAYLRGMIKQFHKIFFATRDLDNTTYYGDMGKNQKSINGLSVRYGTKTTSASLVDNVRAMAVPGAVANVQSSIWLIKWGQDGVYCFYPKTVSRTLQVNDLKEQVVYDASSRPFRAVMTNFAWEFGLAIADERCVQRLCNIATTVAVGSFDSDTTDATQGEKALIDMIERLPGGDTSNCAFYAGPAIMAALRKRLNLKANMFFTMQDVWGRPQLTFMDIPFIRVDSLTPNEAILS